jgi:hypothetical protein
MLLEWLEPVSPVVPARQHISWTYVDMPESSTCAGRENCWHQSLALDLGYSAGAGSRKSLFFCSFSQILHANRYNDYYTLIQYGILWVRRVHNRSELNDIQVYSCELKKRVAAAP